MYRPRSRARCVSARGAQRSGGLFSFCTSRSTRYHSVASRRSGAHPRSGEPTWVEAPDRSSGRPSGGRYLQVGLQPGEEFDRGSCIVADPAVVNLLDREYVEVIPAFTALAQGDDKTGALKNPQVLPGRAQMQVGDVVAQVGVGSGMVREQVEDPATRAVRQGLEHSIGRHVVEALVPGA